MLSKGMQFYIQIPGESPRRILHPATICALDSDLYTAEIKVPDASLPPGAEIRAYFNQGREFMQQAIVIEQILNSAPAESHQKILEDPHQLQLTVTLHTLGKPVSAESRQCYRVSTISAGLAAQLEDETGASLLDISSTGFSVISRQQYELGARVPIKIHHQDHEFSGAASIQSKREFGKNRIRYGFHSLEDRKLGGNLMLGMQTLSMTVQRRQLRRLSGAA